MNEHLQLAINQAIQDRASDIHISSGLPPILRIDGALHPSQQAVLSAEETAKIAEELVPSQRWEEFNQLGELDFSFEYEGKVRFRVNAFFQRGQVSLALRLIPTMVPTLEVLNLPNTIRELAGKVHGLVLVTGPTGSGKSTTLAAMIQYMNQHMHRHIITLEDPIEYLHHHEQSIIEQREVGNDTSSFSNGLRAALRQDPDVIMVGEMRDLETIATAITAAETGHLVLATLHTSSALATIDRIIDVFPSSQQGQIRLQLSNVLQAIISQRLLPLKQGGRRAALEILINNPAVANLIRNEKTHQILTVMQTSRSQGMQTMESAVRTLLNQGLVCFDSASPILGEGGM
ncbi:type IV pilus twitching motility protein PilT [Rubeoparvulum massiliense]|uniref:type IV pilus twitching motility protein PilT n=1 Tax=Rubeoparvulum massiliense TaxID=1631346 RepID=UPI00065DC0C3|nr:type IV pilus twitching motility protein PilT [Rubeoparvulum massiliense]